MQCASIFGSTALISSESIAIFLQRGWRHNGCLHFFSKGHDRHRDSVSAKKKQPPPQVTSSVAFAVVLGTVHTFPSGFFAGARLLLCTSISSVYTQIWSPTYDHDLTFKYTCRRLALPATFRRHAVTVSPLSLINPGVQQRAHQFRLKEPRTLLPMLMIVAMCCWIRQPPPLPRSGKLWGHPWSVEFANGHER